MKISILGAGSWGSAIAILLAKKGYEISLWDRNLKLLEEIDKSKGKHTLSSWSFNAFRN